MAAKAVLVFASLLTGTAQAATDPDGHHSGTARLMGMNIGAKNYHEPDYLKSLARLDIAILGFYPGWRGDKDGEKIRTTVRELRARNPSLLIGQYTILNESTDDLRRGAASIDRIKKINDENWWLRRADGTKVAWTSQYSAYDINFTLWSKADRHGDRYPEWLARRDFEKYFQPVPEFKIWYLDNVMVRSRVPSADWKQVGRDIASRDDEVQTEYRRGMVSHWNAIKRLSPSAYLIGNADNDLSSPEYKRQLHGVFLESLMGKSWSLERRSGWRPMMERYLSVKENLLPPAIVGFNVAGRSNDYRFFRYAFSSFLLGDGYFSYTDSDVGHSSVPWFDEYNIRIGAALDPPQTEPWRNGVYMRRFEHAMVLVNPQDSVRAVDLDPGWTRFRGMQAPETNNGAAISRVELQPRDGLLLIRK